MPFLFNCMIEILTFSCKKHAYIKETTIEVILHSNLGALSSDEENIRGVGRKGEIIVMLPGHTRENFWLTACYRGKFVKKNYWG